ncbi:hypothetical protein SAMN05443572_113178 [Myxococcus fulvus]|uniref:Uncharacterized protein n=1 Tax=Myxococcus fulvus TaxID=33 RepID=A0ABY1CUJ0_MYXFU|nr:hypothetical protein SAMN05443572_113178 [Myxococcus fulvus]
MQPQSRPKRSDRSGPTAGSKGLGEATSRLMPDRSQEAF